MVARSYDQYDGVTAAVEVIGERWALLIVRDLLVGARRYTDLKQGLPRIPTNILSARLKDLQEGGVVQRVPLRHCGLVYELTEVGRSLEPIVLALSRWGVERLGEPGAEDLTTADGLTVALRAAFRPEIAASATPTDYELRVEAVVLRVGVGDGSLVIHQVAPPAPPVAGTVPEGEPDVVLVAGRDLLRGELPRVAAGDPELAQRFAGSFALRWGPRSPLPAVG
ncbi:winged helix-turn-helix transcriptional regulator [Aeromicrobium choanae]|uniref:Transcriptional regulator, HxlR family n=1 Tax=Aeromicrobium choanae TaxID=1736691 RepID=A0A1T4YS21_9ACTN|nr:helix-turn-helix domain-containing protein [Aeromicrobium choanae]SKB04644.1 transcriptional regulator, HxlR family [Aeromicrobium choanae]